MRSVIYDYIKGLKLSNYTLTEHLPWEDNKAGLYTHNKKHIYVDIAHHQQSQFIDTFDGNGAVEEIISVSVFFVTDAKKIPPDYDKTVELIKQARTADGTQGCVQKLCQVSTEYEGDSIITNFDFSFRKIIIN